MSDTYNTRIQHKTDTYDNWHTNNPVPLDGELCIVLVPEGTDILAQEPGVLYKIGDGVTPFSGLPFGAGLSADVYDWAKGETKPVYEASEIKQDTTHRMVADSQINTWDGKAAPPTSVLITLTASGWHTPGVYVPGGPPPQGPNYIWQDVDVPGVELDENLQMIQPMPSMASQAAYIDAGIICTGVEITGVLRFKAETIPTEDLTVYVVITPVNFIGDALELEDEDE